MASGGPLVDVELVLGRVPYPVPLGSITGHVILFGFAVRETSGMAAATVDLYDGADSTGTRAVPISLNTYESTSEFFGPQGVHFRSGLYVVTSGAVAGSIFIADAG